MVTSTYITVTRHSHRQINKSRFTYKAVTVSHKTRGNLRARRSHRESHNQSHNLRCNHSRVEKTPLVNSFSSHHQPPHIRGEEEEEEEEEEVCK